LVLWGTRPVFRVDFCLDKYGSVFYNDIRFHCVNSGAGDNMDVASSRPVKKKAIFWQSFFFVFVVLLAAYVLLQSPLFLIKNVDVRGNSLLTASEVARISGIVTDENIFKADLKTGVDRVKTLPLVKDVDIVRKYPGTVVITVQERVPVALVVVDGNFVELDHSGYYLRQGKAGTTGLPVITGVPVESASPGRLVQGKGLDIALKVVESIPAELCADLSEVHVAGDGCVTLYTLDGVECRLGLPEELDSKGSYILQVLENLRNQNAQTIEYVDFSIISSPVVKYKK